MVHYTGNWHICISSLWHILRIIVQDVNYFGAIALLVMVINDEYKIEFIKFVCFEIEQRYSIVLIQFGTDGDHMHVFVGAAPKYSPSKIM